MCGALSLLVHITDWPALIVTVAGENAKFSIDTVAAGVVGLGLTFALLDEQLLRVNTAIMKTGRNTSVFFMRWIINKYIYYL